jgi:hypothetical protein
MSASFNDVANPGSARSSQRRDIPVTHDSDRTRTRRAHPLIIYKLTKLDVEAFAGSATMSGARSQKSTRLLSVCGLDAPLLYAQNLHPGVEKLGALFPCVRSHEFSADLGSP